MISKREANILIDYSLLGRDLKKVKTWTHNATFRETIYLQLYQCCVANIFNSFEHNTGHLSSLMFKNGNRAMLLLYILDLPMLHLKL